MSTSDPAPLLAIRDLCVDYESPAGVTHAVQDLTLALHAGETLAVVGGSGSGKSTLASSVNRLLPAAARVTGGSIVFEGTELLGLAERELIRIRGRRIALIPQDPMSNLNPLKTIGSQVGEALIAHRLATRATVKDQVIDILAAVGIAQPGQRFAQYPHEFSGGMNQRVLIAMALACQPALLIADEPTSALDVTVQRRVLDLIAVRAGDLGAAVLFITHNLALAAERADRVVVMNEGRIVESGPSTAVLRSPEHPYTCRLVEAIPSFTQPARPANGTTAAVAPVPEEPLIETRGLRRVFPARGRSDRAPDVVAVDDVSFSIRKGQIVSIVGESGSGKTTVANLVLGLDRPNAGTIVYRGTDSSRLDRRGWKSLRRTVQPVFQNPYGSLDPRMTITRSISEPLDAHDLSDRTGRRARARELLEQVGLSSAMADRYPHELSGGQRQRVAIARALALSPDLIVLDEAVSALDVLIQHQILELLIELQQQHALSYLFVSHDLAVVRMISDEVLVMRNGAIVEKGSPQDLFSDPKSEYTRELIAAIPRPV